MSLREFWSLFEQPLIVFRHIRRVEKRR